MADSSARVDGFRARNFVPAVQASVVRDGSSALPGPELDPGPLTQSFRDNPVGDGS